MLDFHKIAKDLPHFLPILGIYVAGIIAFWQFSYDKQFQTGAILAVGVSHVVWGIVHHSIHKDLSLEIVLEYIMVAILGVSSVLVMIYS